MSTASSSTSSNDQQSSSSVKAEKLEYLEQKYGNKASHVNLSREEVNAMVDKVLKDSPTVQYLLQSLKQVTSSSCSYSSIPNCNGRMHGEQRNHLRSEAAGMHLQPHTASS